MHKTSWLIAALSMLFWITAIGNNVEAKDLKFHSELSGSFTSTVINTTGTGSNAVLTIMERVGTFGRITAQGVGQWSNLAKLVNCPAGTVVEAQIVTARGVLRVEDGDLLYTEFSSGTSCTDASGVTTFTTEGTFIGGTGKFAKATGNESVEKVVLKTSYQEI